MSKIQFKEVSLEEVSAHINAWKEQLQTPHDDMWWSFCLAAQTLAIEIENKSIGFASVNEEGQLIRFYVDFSHLDWVSRVMRALVDSGQIKSAIIGTHDTASLHGVSSLGAIAQPHSLLYELQVKDQLQGIEHLNKATTADHARVVDYYHATIQAPIEWLNMYVGERIEKGEFYFLELNNTIAGSSEVRAHSYSENHAAIGIAVHPDFRKKGLGTQLLGQAAKMAIENEKNPICSTEKENYGSIKAIEANGFRSKYQLLEWSFDIS